MCKLASKSCYCSMITLRTYFVITLILNYTTTTTTAATTTTKLLFPTLARFTGKLNICFFCDLRCIREIESFGYNKSHINDYYRDNVHKVSNAFQDNGIQISVAAPHIVKFNTMYDDLLFKGTDLNTGRYNLVKLMRYFFKKRIPTKSWLKVGCNVIFWTPASDDLVFRNTSLAGFSHRYQICKDEPYGMIRLTRFPALNFLREVLNLMGVDGDDEVPRSTYHYKLFEPLTNPVLHYCSGNKGTSCSSADGQLLPYGECVMKSTNRDSEGSSAAKKSLKMSNCTKAYLEFWLQVGNRYPTIYSHQCLK